MSCEFELGLLEDINIMLEKLQKKIDKLIITQSWLNKLKQEVETKSSRGKLYV